MELLICFRYMIPLKITSNMIEIIKKSYPNRILDYNDLRRT